MRTYRAAPVLRMSGADDPVRSPITLFTFNSREDIAQFATGSDGDIGGMSSAHLDLDESTAQTSTGPKALVPPRPTAKFWGEMRLATRPGYERQVRAGYAGMKSKVRRTSVSREVCEELTEEMAATNDVVRRDDRRRLESLLPCTACPHRRPSPHAKLVLREHPDGRTCYK